MHAQRLAKDWDKCLGRWEGRAWLVFLHVDALRSHHERCAKDQERCHAARRTHPSANAAGLACRHLCTIRLALVLVVSGGQARAHRSYSHKHRRTRTHRRPSDEAQVRLHWLACACERAWERTCNGDNLLATLGIGVRRDGHLGAGGATHLAVRVRAPLTHRRTRVDGLRGVRLAGAAACGARRIEVAGEGACGLCGNVVVVVVGASRSLARDLVVVP